MVEHFPKILASEGKKSTTTIAVFCYWLWIPFVIVLWMPFLTVLWMPFVIVLWMPFLIVLWIPFLTVLGYLWSLVIDVVYHCPWRPFILVLGYLLSLAMITSYPWQKNKKKNDSRSHASFGPKIFNCQIRISNLSERMGWNCFWYLISFIKFYQNFQTSCLSFCNTRKEDTVLNRLHIGHSYFTHSLLWEKKRLLFVLHVIL